MRVPLIVVDGGREDETGFTMRLAAVILPDLGTGPAVPIVISHWYAARGDQVWEGDRLVEVLVGPATFDVSSPASGQLAAIHGWEDDTIVAGAVLGVVATADIDAHDDDAPGASRQREPGDEPPPSRPTT